MHSIYSMITIAHISSGVTDGGAWGKRPPGSSWGKRPPGSTSYIRHPTLAPFKK